MRFEMKMPDLAATESDIRISQWLIEPGDEVQRGQPIVEVETDKATMEVESSVSGALAEILTPEDGIVAVGQVIAFLEVDDSAPGTPGGEGSDASTSTSPKERATPAPPAANERPLPTKR